MNKPLTLTLAILTLAGSVYGQGLYDIAPNDEATESSPISWSAGISYNYDDNVTPTAGVGQGSDDKASSISAYVGASLVSITPQTTWDIFTRLGGNFYIDSLEAPNSEDLYTQARLGINLAHRINERLRLSSRNYIAYELEPDYSYGFSTDRQLEEYLHYKTDNAVGYRWNERFATYTGVSVRGVLYGSADNASDNDRTLYNLYNQFRYRASEQTVWTLDYRYSTTDSSGTASDSKNQFITLGAEHRFSPTSVFAVKAGMQLRDVADGEDENAPFAEAAIRTRMNDQLSIRSFARYSIEDYGTSFENFTYDNNTTLRVGVSADYTISPDLTLQAGANVIMMDMQDGRSSPPGSDISDAQTDLLNLYLGFSYRVNDVFYLTGSYNWTDSDSDLEDRTYDRNRVSLGLRAEF
jgi:hypothetical protein